MSKWVATLAVVAATLALAGCGDAREEKFIGTWSASEGYLELRLYEGGDCRLYTTPGSGMTCEWSPSSNYSGDLTIEDNSSFLEGSMTLVDEELMLSSGAWGVVFLTQ